MFVCMSVPNQSDFSFRNAQLLLIQNKCYSFRKGSANPQDERYLYMIILKYTIQCKFRTIVLPISFLSNVISLSLSFLGGKFRGFFYLFIVIKLVSGLYTMKIVIILCASDRYRSEMGLSEQNYLLNSYNGLFDLSLNFRKKRA